MGTPATGSVEPFKRTDGKIYFRARIRLTDGSRERVDVPAKYTTDERRRLYAAAIQEREDERGELYAKKLARIAAKAAADAPREATKPETFAAYRTRLNEHRDTLGHGAGDASAWRAWIVPHLGHHPAATIGQKEIEVFRDVLDEAIRTYTSTEGADGISPKRALNIWSEVTTTCKAMVSAKRADLRVRADNPCSTVLAPERGDGKRKTFIYPAELAAVLSAPMVPLEWREVYAIGSYLYLRPGELRALTWADVDVDAQLVHITKAFDERTGKVTTPKTANGVRDVPIPPTLAPLLERMKRNRAPTDLVVPILATLTENRRATNLRADLQRAGCNRPRLTENTATTMGVNFRSLRDSGITWLALSRVDVVRMQRRAGHDSLETTMGYVKQAEDLGGKIGEPFGPLPPALVAGVHKEGVASGSRQQIAARHRAKHRAKFTSEVAEGPQSRGVSGSARGTGASEIRENPDAQCDSRAGDLPRDAASARTVVDVGPTGSALGPDARTVLVAALTKAIADATASGDMQAARIAHTALGQLLTSSSATPAEVVVLDARRRER